MDVVATAKSRAGWEGSWPVMMTAFNADGSLDLPGIDSLTDWYIDSGAAGLFGTCLSSEAHLMTPEELVTVTKRVVARTAGRVPVVAGAMGNLPRDADRSAMVRELHAAGADAVVLVSNNFAAESETEADMERRLIQLAAACPGVPLGLYECPVPYKRLVNCEVLGRLAKTGRFIWSKDTCCDAAEIGRRIAATRGTGMQIFNAYLNDMRTVIRAGGHGFSGIFANFFPRLVSDLCDPRSMDDKGAQDFFEQVVQINDTLVNTHYAAAYPAIAKEAARRQGVRMGTHCRHPCTLTAESLADLETSLEAAGSLSPVGQRA